MAAPGRVRRRLPRTPRSRLRTPLPLLRARSDLPMPGSPSISTELPRPLGEVSDEPRQEGHLAIAADQPTGRRNRVHATNFTTDHPWNKRTFFAP